MNHVSRCVARASGLIGLLMILSAFGCDGPPEGSVKGATPTRIFAGPNQYPPLLFAAYGIVAFPTLAAPGDVPRYRMICEAYTASLISSGSVTVPRNLQMVTVWPIDSDPEAISINKMERGKECEPAVSHYGLLMAQTAIADARSAHARVDGLGPYLLAWSPSGQKGVADALVLVSDFSEVTTSDQAKTLFVQWARDIEENPQLWEKGWNMAKLKLLVRLWADKYGERLLQLAGGEEHEGNP